MTFRVIFFHPFGYVMQNRGLARPRGGDDQSPLSFSHRAEKVKHPGGHSSVFGFQIKFVLGLNGRQLIEAELLLSLLQRHAVHCMYVANLWVLSAFVGVGIGPDDGAFA